MDRKIETCTRLSGVQIGCAHQDVPVVKYLGGLYQRNLPQTRPSFLVHIKQVWQHNLQRIFSADKICIHVNTLQNHCNDSVDTMLSGPAVVLCFVKNAHANSAKQAKHLPKKALTVCAPTTCCASIAASKTTCNTACIQATHMITYMTGSLPASNTRMTSPDEY